MINGVSRRVASFAEPHMRSFRCSHDAPARRRERGAVSKHVQFVDINTNNSVKRKKVICIAF